jgi:RNA polymerase sigma factor (sigma-70 family)
METDEARYARFLQGDNKALEELIGIHKESLTLFLYGFLKNMAEAENMMIDVFAQLVVSRAKFKGDSTFKTYLFAIGRNEACSYLKRNKRHLPLEEIEDNLLTDEAVNEISLLQEERNRELYSAINTLPEGYRQVLFLLYFEEMSYRQAAEVMKKSEKQITNLAYRAKKALKKNLDRKGFVYHG